MENLTHRVNAYPLLAALTAIRDAGRARKESGVDDEAVAYARIAAKAVAWFDADEEGSFPEAQVLLDELYALIGVETERPPDQPGTPLE